MKITTTFIFVLLFCSSQISGQDTLSFEAAIEAAMQHNFDIQIAANEEAIAATNAHPGATGLLPLINTNATTNYSLGTSNITFIEPFPSQKVTGASSLRNSANVGLTYVLFDGLQNINGFRRLKEEAKQANLQKQFQMEQVAVQVAQLYYTLAQAQAILALNKRVTEISQERYDRAVIKTEFGQSKRLELNANVDFITDSITILNNVNDINNLKSQLNILLGRKPNTPINVDSDISIIDNFVLADLLTNARDQNTGIQLTQKGIDISALNLKLSKQGLFPSLSANTGYGVDNFKGDAGQLTRSLNNQFFGGLTFNYAIFDGNITRKRMQSAQLVQQNAQLTNEQFALQTEADILNTYSDYQTALTILKLQGENLEKVVDNFTRTELGFNQGNLTGLEYREAQLAVARAESIILQAKYNAKILEYRLLQLSGNLLE